MPKARFVVLIEGKVQKGGFRSFVKKLALGLGITGYAEDLSSGEVMAVAEGEDKNLEKLVKSIEKEAPAYIKVDRITKRKEKYRGSFTDFERKGTDVIEGLEDRGVKEVLLSMVSYAKATDEKLEKGIEILSDIKKDTSDIKKDTSDIKKDTSDIKKDTSDIKKDTSGIKKDTSAILEKQDAMLEKQDSMLEKQDGLKGTMEGGFNELKSTMEQGFGELKGVVEHGFSELKEEHIKTRELSKEIFYAEVQELRRDLNSLRSTVEEIKRKVEAI